MSIFTRFSIVLLGFTVGLTPLPAFAGDLGFSAESATAQEQPTLTFEVYGKGAYMDEAYHDAVKTAVLQGCRAMLDSETAELLKTELREQSSAIANAAVTDKRQLGQAVAQQGVTTVRLSVAMKKAPLREKLAQIIEAKKLEDTVLIEATGTAENQDAAMKQAIKSAIFQAVGGFVKAETILANDEIIKDEIISKSSSLVVKATMLKLARTDDKLVIVRIRAWVKQKTLKEHLLAVKLMNEDDVQEQKLRDAVEANNTQTKKEGSLAP